jgi:DNA helicase-2/ATP-dependent DNA helicase PcrA
MDTIKSKPILLIAGAGSGKTTEMVREIISVLPHLQRNRVLATVTYTNSATETIRSRVGQQIYVPRNVFIGTIHQFLNQFILVPYATLFDYVGPDKLFLDIDVDDLADSKVSLPSNSKFYNAVKNKIRGNILRTLLEDGKVPLNQIGAIAAKLMEVEEVQRVVCNMLQLLFIDEFQDVDSYQFQIFERIRKGGRTKIYAVGDPEQYILGFTYRGKKKPAFSELPINRFKADRQYKTENHRAFNEIVRFTNQFHCEIQQVSHRGSNPAAIVAFLKSHDLAEIMSRYQVMCLEASKTKQQNASHFTCFYLSFKNKTFADLATQFGLTPLMSEKPSFNNTLDQSLDLICSLVGKTQRQMADYYRLDALQARKLGVKLIQAIDSGNVVDKDTLINFVVNDFKLQVSNDEITSGKDLFHSLCTGIKGSQVVQSYHQFSSIHKAKGLEADAVLVVAESALQLDRWLTIDKTERVADKTDMCRIGYVGFTRAKQLLCIACLEKISEGIYGRLENLMVNIIEPETTSKQLELPLDIV